MPKFRKGEIVMVNAVVPAGPVLAFRMTEDGVVQCLIEWADADGEVQQRWFDEDSLKPGA
jgi:uncharacterized protein YodC (DUF2158 family)